MTPIRDRPTPDLIVMWLAAIIGTVVLGTLAVSVLSVIRNPDADIEGTLAFVGDMTAALMTGVIGYIGGRATTTKEDKPPPNKSVR